MPELRFAPIVEPPRPRKPTKAHERRQLDRQREAINAQLRAYVERIKGEKE